MQKMSLSVKVFPILFDFVVWSGFAAFLIASYVAYSTFAERFSEPVHKLIGLVQSFMA